VTLPTMDGIRMNFPAVSVITDRDARAMRLRPKLLVLDEPTSGAGP